MPTTKVADIVRQLSAADKFLKNVRSLSSFGAIEQQQTEKIQAMLRNGKFNEEQGSRLAEGVQSLVYFSKASTALLLQSVADACHVTVDKSPSASTGPSADSQDYSSLHRYLTESVWKQLLGEPSSRLHALCSFAAKLGLFCPTEKTVGTFTVLLFWNEWKNQKVMPLEKYQTYYKCRAQVRAVLKEYNCVASQELRLPHLPPVFAELPPTHQKLFGPKEFLDGIYYIGESF